MSITVKDLARELGIRTPSLSHGTAADWLLSWDQTLADTGKPTVTDDTVLSGEYADMIRETWTAGDTDERMAGAELAVTRHLLGLSVDDLADELEVNPRTVRSWEQGRDPIPDRVPDELAELRDRHDRLVGEMLHGPSPVRIRYEKDYGTGPRGWRVAAAARAMGIYPDLEVEWG